MQISTLKTHKCAVSIIPESLQTLSLWSRIPLRSWPSMLLRSHRIISHLSGQLEECSAAVHPNRDRSKWTIHLQFLTYFIHCFSPVWFHFGSSLFFCLAVIVHAYYYITSTAFAQLAFGSLSHLQVGDSLHDRRLASIVVQQYQSRYSLNIYPSSHPPPRILANHASSRPPTVPSPPWTWLFSEPFLFSPFRWFFARCCEVYTVKYKTWRSTVSCHSIHTYQAGIPQDHPSEVTHSVTEASVSSLK